MGEKSEVQNLTEPSVAGEPLDATPLAVDAGQVQQGEPKDYRKGVQEDDGEPYATQDRPPR